MVFSVIYTLNSGDPTEISAAQIPFVIGSLEPGQSYVVAMDVSSGGDCDEITTLSETVCTGWLIIVLHQSIKLARK